MFYISACVAYLPMTADVDLAIQPQIPHLHTIDWLQMKSLMKGLTENYCEMVTSCLNSSSNLYGHTPQFPRLGIRHWNLEDCIRCSSTDFTSLQEAGVSVFCRHFNIDAQTSSAQLAWCKLWNCAIIEALVCVARTYSSFLLITNTSYDPRHFAFNLKETVYHCLGMESLDNGPWHQISEHRSDNDVYTPPVFFEDLIKHNFATRTFQYRIHCQPQHLTVIASWAHFKKTQLAFAMATHAKLGQNSPASDITADLIQHIFKLILKKETR